MEECAAAVLLVGMAFTGCLGVDQGPCHEHVALPQHEPPPASGAHPSNIRLPPEAEAPYPVGIEGTLPWFQVAGSSEEVEVSEVKVRGLPELGRVNPDACEELDSTDVTLMGGFDGWLTHAGGDRVPVEDRVLVAPLMDPVDLPGVTWIKSRAATVGPDLTRVECLSSFGDTKPESPPTHLGIEEGGTTWTFPRARLVEPDAFSWGGTGIGEDHWEYEDVTVHIDDGEVRCLRGHVIAETRSIPLDGPPSGQISLHAPKPVFTFNGESREAPNSTFYFEDVSGRIRAPPATSILDGRADQWVQAGRSRLRGQMEASFLDGDRSGELEVPPGTTRSITVRVNETSGQARLVGVEGSSSSRVIDVSTTPLRQSPDVPRPQGGGSDWPIALAGLFFPFLFFLDVDGDVIPSYDTTRTVPANGTRYMSVKASVPRDAGEGPIPLDVNLRSGGVHRTSLDLKVDVRGR